MIAISLFYSNLCWFIASEWRINMKILITGGTGSLGTALLKRYSSENDYVIDFTYNKNIERAQRLAEQYHCNALKIDEISDDYDIVINNVGIVNSLVPCEEVLLDNWNETLQVNLTIPFLIIKKNLKHMKEQGWGRIVNISSIYGVVAEEDVTPYAVSKHGLIGLTRSVAKEYGRYGITCNSVCPATIESEMSDHIADHYTSNKDEKKQYFHALCDAVPIGRLVTPEEIADFIFFVTSEQAAYINGATLMIDGGYNA